MPTTPSSPSAQSALAWLRAQPHRPTTSAEALSLYIHALLLTHGFRPQEAPPTPDTPSTLPQALPAGWGRSGFGGRYRHSRSSLSFDVTYAVVGARLVVHAAAVEDDAQMHTAQLRVAEHVRDGVQFAHAEHTLDWDHVLERVDDVATIVQVQIAHRLVPDAAKEGYEQAAQANTTEAASASASASGGAGPPPPRGIIPPSHDPLRDPDHDPLRIGPPRRPGGMMPMPFPGMGDGFGSDDLLAPGLPRPGGFPGGGPGGMFGGGGGNLMGPGNFPGSGGRGWPRPEGVPPGARFDPYTPFGPDNDAERMPGFEDEHGIRGGGRRAGGRGGGGGRGRGDGAPPGMFF